MLNNIPTEDDLAWVRQKSYEMRRAIAIRNLGKISEREKLFWEKQKQSNER